MPNPLIITRSSSDLGITKTHHSGSGSGSHSHSCSLPPSKHSSHSSDSQRSISWPKKVGKWPKKVGSYITKKSSPKNSDLTEESLEEFNKRNETAGYNKKRSFYSTGASPYYKGLTDFSLALNRERLSAKSPGGESNGSSISSGSKSSFVVKMQEWTSWFDSFSREEKVTEVLSTRSAQSSRSKDAHTSSSSSSSSSSLMTRATMTTLEKEFGLEGKVMSVGMTGNNEFSLVKKPLRERNSEHPLSPPPPPPPRAQPSRLPASPPQAAQVSPESLPPPPSLPEIAQKSLQLKRRPPSPPPTPQTSPANRIKLKEDTSQTTNERVYVWADKYRPEALKDFICHRNKALELRALIKAEDCDCGHYIFEGPPGVGKRTMIWALLREAFGPDRIQTREESKQFVLKGESEGSIEVTVKISLQHVEVNLSEVKGYEKNVVVELIQETINSLSKKGLQCNKDRCRVIILHEADKLSADALLYIKWQLMRQRGCSKVFFCCTDASKLHPMASFCTVVKLLPPSNEEIVGVLEFIAKQEGIELSHQLAEKIADNSKNNLRQAIRSFEASWEANSLLMEDQVVVTGWEDDIANIAKNIVEEQSPKQLYIIRGKLQNLIEYNVCPAFIFQALVEELKKHLAEEFQTQVDNLYEEFKNLARHRHEETDKRYNDPVKRNLHHFLRIEEFVAKFMSCYKMSMVNKKGI